MPQKPKTLGAYLKELEDSKDSREEQVRVGVEIFVELWRKSIEKEIVSEDDPVDVALEKVERAGGLYKAAET